MKLRENILIYTLVPLLLFFLVVSYFRFFVVHDYMIKYETTCNPNEHDCFFTCLDDSCSDKSYYKKIEKYEPYLNAQCGEDITNCDASSTCTQQDNGRCSIIYCDNTKDECSKNTSQ